MLEDYGDRMVYVYYVHDDDINDDNGTMIMKMIITNRVKNFNR